MENKSFLRKKWENYFLSITKKRISTKSLEKKELLIINDKKALEEILNN